MPVDSNASVSRTARVKKNVLQPCKVWTNPNSKELAKLPLGSVAYLVNPQWQEDRARSVQFGARHAPVVRCSDLYEPDSRVFGALRTGDAVFVFDDLDTQGWIRGTLTRDSHHLRAAIQVSDGDLWTAPWHYIAAARSDVAVAPHEEPRRGPYEGALYLASELEVKRDGDDLTPTPKTYDNPWNVPNAMLVIGKDVIDCAHVNVIDCIDGSFVVEDAADKRNYVRYAKAGIPVPEYLPGSVAEDRIGGWRECIGREPGAEEAVVSVHYSDGTFTHVVVPAE